MNHDPRQCNICLTTNKYFNRPSILNQLFNAILENIDLTVHPIWNQSIPELLKDKRRAEIIEKLVNYEKEKDKK